MTTTSGVTRSPRPSSLADVLDLILDKGLVIDAYVRVSLVGIELLTVDARVVVASVDTYLRFAEAVNRLDLQPQGQVTGLPGLVQGMTEKGARSKTRGALGGVRDTMHEVKDAFTGHGGDNDRRDGEQRESRQVPAGRRASGDRSGDRER